MTRRHSPRARSGAALVAVLAVLVIVCVLAAVLAQGVVAEHRRVREHERRLQAELLLEAGRERGRAQLALDPAYAGEDWEAPVSAGAVVVEIRVVREGGEARIEVRTRALEAPKFEIRNAKSETNPNF